MFTLPPLPYADSALAPVISAKTLGFHYGKHHKAYVDNLNNLVEGHGIRRRPAREDHREDGGQGRQGADLQQRGADLEPHVLLEQPEARRRRQADRRARADDRRDLGGYDAFSKDFAGRRCRNSESGWAWLVQEGGKLKLVKTGNAKSRSPRARSPC